MATRRYPAGSDVTFTYDYSGRQTAMQDGVADTVYAWDSYGGVTCYDHLVAVRRKYGSMTTYRDTTNQYDANYNRTSLRDGEGNITTYAYDSLNRLTGMAYAGQTASFAYDAAGNRTLKTLPNGAYTEYDYNSRNMLTELRNRKSDGTIISSYAYSLDDAGNRASMTELNGDVTSYGYDDCDRLTGETKRDSQNAVLYSYAYTYDDAGNRLTMTKDGVGTTYTYDAANKLTQFVDSNGTTTFGYDNNGNTTSMDPPGPAAWDYGYSYENLLTSATDGNGYTAAYGYGGDGLRLHIQESNHQYPDRWLQYDGVRPLLEGTLMGNDFTTTSGYIWEGPDQYHLLLGVCVAGVWLSPLADGIGSVRQTLSAAQSVTDSYSFSAFGELVTRTGSTVNPFSFVGTLGYYQEGDGAAQLGSREYVATIGGFRQSGPGSIMSDHAYCRARPTTLVDPDGEIAQAYSPSGQPLATDQGPHPPMPSGAAIRIHPWSAANSFRCEDDPPKRCRKIPMVRGFATWFYCHSCHTDCVNACRDIPDRKASEKCWAACDSAYIVCKSTHAASRYTAHW